MTAPAFTFGTLCSGIEAASEAFLPLGSECRFVSEIEPYPCGVLAQRHGATRPMRMPDPEAVEFPDGYDPADRALYTALAKVLGSELPPSDMAFIQAWTTRADRRAAIRAIERFVPSGGTLPNYGDLTQIVPEELPAVDLLVAGFPCQDFSIAGLRQSLEGARGNLTLFGVKLIHELVRLRRIRSALLEQVPDILNTKDNAFGALLGGLVGHDAPLVSSYRGGRWTNAGVADGPLGTAAWRVLDAQYAGVAQRRERLFLVGSFGDGPDPVEVLFERQGVSRYPPARRKAGEGLARPLAAGTAGSGGYRNDADTAENLIPVGAQRRTAFGGNNTSGELEVHTALNACHTASGRQDFETEAFIVEAPDVAHPLLAKHNSSHREDADTLIAHSLRGERYAASEGADFTVQPIAYNLYPAGPDAATHAAEADISYALTAKGEASKNGNGLHIAMAIPINQNALRGDSEAKTPSPDAEGRVRLRDPGLGVGQDGDPADTLTAAGPHAVAFSLRGREGGAQAEVEDGDVAPALRSAEGGSTRPFVAFDETQITSKTNRSNPQPGDPCHPLASGARPPTLASAMAVRRITTREAERLQGFRDGYTLIDWPTANRKGDELAEQIAYLLSHGYDQDDAERLAQTPDGPMYKALGNSKAVPLVRKLGERYAAALARYLSGKVAA